MNQHSAWTKEEVEILRRLYPEGGVEACMEVIKNHPPSGIINKANRMKITLSKEKKSERVRKGLKGLTSTRPEPPAPLPDEYIQASDIFQVGFRVARGAGVLDQYR